VPSVLCAVGDIAQFTLLYSYGLAWFKPVVQYVLIYLALHAALLYGGISCVHGRQMLIEKYAQLTLALVELAAC